MNAEKRDQIRRTLRSLAEAHASEMKLMEQMSALLDEELALDAATFGRRAVRRRCQRDQTLLYKSTATGKSSRSEASRASSEHGLPFRFVAYLAGHLNSYLSYTDSAIRSVVKRLRSSLRQSGMDDLANAVDGSVPGAVRPGTGHPKGAKCHRNATVLTRAMTRANA